MNTRIVNKRNQVRAKPRAQKRRQRKVRTRQVTKVVVQRTPRKRANRRRRTNGPRGIAGVGISKGGELVNARTHSAPEIREGEELIATVMGSVGFTTTQFNINPANSTTFPWLSKIAQLFERYEFEALSFHFGHDVSGFATQGQTGLVYLSALYDAASAAPTSVTQIEATDPFVPAMPNQDSCCRLNKKSMHPSNEPKFCLQGNPPGGTDIKTYNAGSVFVSTTGMANTTEIGKFRVRYRVRLFDRILDATPSAAPANFSASFFQSAAPQALVTTVNANLLVATATNNGLSVVNTAGSFVPPAGNYLLDTNVFFKDSVAETTNQTLDIRKNGASIFAVTPNVIEQGGSETSITQSVFVTANGTDAFTIVLNMVGATGVLTASGTVRFVAA